jgi:eukaryotic-like serine/threonine-protein kinase
MIEVKTNEYHRVLLARITLVTAMSLLGGLSVGIAYAQFSTDQTTSLAQQQGDWSQYQNVTYGVSMLYPFNWTQQNSTGDADDRFIYVSDFFSPEETDGYFAYVTIAIDSMPNTTNIETYRNQSIDIFRQDPEFQEFQLLSSSMGNFTLAGMPAYSFEIIYTDLEFGPQNMLEVGTIFDNRVYYIQYFADTPIYQKYFPIAERMIESFQIMQ